MSPKTRANGTGSIYFDKRYNIYRVQYTIGRDPKTGKYLRKSFRCNSQEEAEERLSKILVKLRAGQYPFDSEIQLKDWLKIWIEEYKVNELEKTTLDNYKTNIKNHIEPHLGRRRLSEISTRDIQLFYNFLYDHGRADGEGGLDPRTVQRIHVILSSALKHAMRHDLIVKNPAQFTVRRKVKRYSINPYNLEELKDFLLKTKDDRMYAAYVLSALTGLRRSEILALKWEDIDLERKEIQISKSLSMVKESENDTKRMYEIKDTKTESSIRIVSFDQFVKKVLERHCRMQNEIMETEIVFSRPDGRYINPSSYTYEFISSIEKHGLRRIRLHDLRHTYATLLLESGVHHNFVKDMLGHSTIVTTLDIYTHVNRSELHKASSKLEEALSMSQ